MKTVYACQGSHLALSCPPEHQIRVVSTIFMSHNIKNHRRDLFLVIGFNKITLDALTSPNLLGQHCLSSPVLMVSIIKKDRTKLNILSTLFFSRFAPTTAASPSRSATTRGSPTGASTAWRQGASGLCRIGGSGHSAMEMDQYSLLDCRPLNFNIWFYNACLFIYDFPF